ncbi:MAG: MotA/TolQ/ExbB proton channel family protein [Planctomycetota bacterium]
MTVTHILAQDDAPGTSLITLLQAGGVIGYVIIALSIVALVLATMHLFHFRLGALAPPDVIDELERLLRAGDTRAALEFAQSDEHRCFLAHVISAGLTRYSRSPFGALELKGALEEAGREQVARLYRSTDALALVAGIAPMLGLLGTVVGINGAFASISTSEGFGRPDQLAGDISLALVTTILGLTLAIPTTAAVTFFRNRIDALASELGSIVDALAAYVEAGAQQPRGGTR